MESEISTSSINVNDLIQSPSEDSTIEVERTPIINYRDFRGIKNQIKIHGNERIRKTDNSEKSIKKTFNQYMQILQAAEEERKQHKEEWLTKLKQSENFYTDF